MAHPQSSKRPRSSQRKAQLTRDRLVRAALTLMTERGYYPTTTPEIARTAGVAEGTIYRHFRGKQHLLNEMFRAGVGVFRDRIPSTGASDCRTRLAATAEAWRQLAVHDAPLARLVLLRPWGDLLDPQSREAARQLREDIEHIVAAGKADGVVRAGPASVLADVWLTLIRRVLDETASGNWSESHASATLVVEAAWDAIRTPHTARHPT